MPKDRFSFAIRPGGKVGRLSQLGLQSRVYMGTHSLIPPHPHTHHVHSRKSSAKRDFEQRLQFPVVANYIDKQKFT